jgi:secreted PhoX family phosphatase
MDRRRFLQNLSIAVSIPTLSVSGRAADAKIGPLRPDPDGILDLPDGYGYTIVSRAGERMDDGLVVPHAHDGMAAFPGENGRVILVCNHELRPANFDQSAFADGFGAQPKAVTDRVYDLGDGKTPGAGGTTTTVYNPETRATERQHLSLAGTELNCAGGPTPWGSWLSCEECFELPGNGLSAGRIVQRDQPHGYVFEVPSSAEGLVEPVPIRAMGRFEHEATAVHEPTGIVYMTEDRHHSLFYRYIPNVPGKLHEGGKLQALAIDEQPAFMTHNWSSKPQIVPGESLRTRWINLDKVNSRKNDLRLRGTALGAATFARGEGLCNANGDMVFTCTIGGPARLGQVFAYQPSPYEGQPLEGDGPGQLTLIAEATHESILRNADNITFAPWGDLIVCEDTASHCGLVGIRPDGSQYQLADNSHTNSELAGVCISPDGKTLFVNIQYPGMTLAITGPFPA